MLIRLVVAFLFLVTFAGVSCSEEDGTTVRMVPGRSFEPESLTIAVGETVTWTSVSDEAHTVTAVEDALPEGAEYFASGGFSSEQAANDDLGEGLLSQNESFEHVFDEPGTYRYYCIPHRDVGMTGTVIVEP